MTQKKTISIEITAEENIFPAHHVKEVYRKIAPYYNQHSAITEEIAQRLADRLKDNKDNQQKFLKILDLGAGTGILEKIIQKQQQPTLFVSADFSAPMLKQAQGLKVLLNAEDDLPFNNQTFDLVISNLMLPWVNDMAKCLHMIGKTLKEDGLFLASTLGAESFKEFRYAFEQMGKKNSHIIPLPDVQSVGAVLQRRGFALPVVDRDTLILSYPNFKTLYQDIQNLGAKNLNPHRKKGLTTKKQWQKMEQIYKDSFTLPDGTLQLTLEIIYLHGLRPHKSQQKALKPGSAQTSLRSVLK